MNAAAMFVLINGYPGVGKLTVANELAKLLPKAKVFNNHLLIDAAAALYERSDPEYPSLRKALRQAVFSSLAASQTARSFTWIFTEQQSSSPSGSATVKEYLNAARNMRSPLISVVLSCGPEENARRVISGDRGSTNTKLTDLSILKHIRDTEDIFHFGNMAQFELDIDVTTKSAIQVAKEIFDQIQPLPLPSTFDHEIST